MQSFRETFDLIIACDGSFCPLVDTLGAISGDEKIDREHGEIAGYEALLEILNDVNG